MKEIYLRFLALANVMDGTSVQLSAIDETAKQLLNVIASHHAQGKPMTVTQAMALSSLASQATIHRKIMVIRFISDLMQMASHMHPHRSSLLPMALSQPKLQKLLLFNLLTKSSRSTT